MRSSLAALGLVFVVMIRPTLAQPKPGDSMTSADADRVNDLVSPGVDWLVRRGMAMKIIAY